MNSKQNEITAVRTDQSDKSRRLNTRNINHHNYTLTLLTEAVRCGLISDDEADSVRIGITNALESSVMTFTSGDSSSVMTGTANSLLHSVLFATDAYLLSLKNDYRAAEELRNTKIPHLYELGMKQLKIMIYETISLLAKCRAGRIATVNDNYNDTIDRQITDYLRTYNIATNAHISCSLTYKPFISAAYLDGIYRVRASALYLSYENDFCSSYGIQEINAMYKRWCDQNGESYSGAKVNIYEIVYTSALLCDYLKKEHGTLTLSRSDCELICRLLGDCDDEMIGNILRNTASHLIYGNGEYNSRCLDIILPRLIRVIKNGNLHNIIPIETGV